MWILDLTIIGGRSRGEEMLEAIFAALAESTGKHTTSDDV